MSHNEHIAAQFDRETLREICIMPEESFSRSFGMTRTNVAQKAPDNFYLYQDNGASVLAVAHLDTVAPRERRKAHYVSTEAGLVVHSRALDDRLGAYVILDLLPRLGVKLDYLLTVGEETGQSTADFYDGPKPYNWVIEFDRGGTDVVMYQFEDDDTIALVEDSGAVVGNGLLSDICYLEQLGVKAFNWGVGYRDYHGPRSHAYLEDTFGMVATFLDFHADNAELVMPHDSRSRPYRYWWDDSDLDDLDDSEPDYPQAATS